jgi:hypothetical protein
LRILKVKFPEFKRDFVFLLQGREDTEDLVFAANNEEEYDKWVKSFEKMYDEIELKRLNMDV